MESRVGTMFGRYKIIGLVGQGGMGSVYQAYDTDKDRTIALKVLAEQYSHDERFRARFIRESRAAAKLQEPHVIPIHDWGEVDGNLFIDMRLVAGSTLHEMLKNGPLEPARAVGIVEQVAAALDAAHGQGLIHRDVKPQNIIVTPAGFAYLLDFGIAESMGESHLTMEGGQIGTFQYMAPERFSDQEGTPAVDVYSLACVLFEALAGVPPFRAATFEGLLSAHLTAPPPRPSAVNPAVPVALDEVIARGMAKEPDDRYGTPGALGRAAARALRDESSFPSGGFSAQAPPESAIPTQVRTGPIPHQVPPAPDPAVGPAGPGARSRKWVLPTVAGVAATVLLAAIGVVIGVLANRSSGSSTSNSPVAPYSVPNAVPVPVSAAAPPPMLTGPDNSAAHQSCDHGFSLPDAAGWATHSGRGTAETSCYFANSVLTSYWAHYGNASREQRTVSAPGMVSCSSVPGAVCDSNDHFIVNCVAYGQDPWITCTGGNNARVYLY